MNKTEMNELYKVMFADFPDIVNIEELRKMLGISRHLAYDLITDEKIDAVKIGNAYKIPKISVIRYVLNCNKAFPA